MTTTQGKTVHQKLAEQLMQQPIFGWTEISGDYHPPIVNNDFIFYTLMFRVLLLLVIICIYILDRDREEFHTVIVTSLNE